MPAARWIPPTRRAEATGRRHMVAAGHDLATTAGLRILDGGGNAIDAGVAAGICMNVVQSDLTNLGGVAPILVYLRETGQVQSISGLGSWPARADAEWFRRERSGRIPPGIRRCVVPAALDAWLTALEQFGTLPLATVLEPAIELARGGFPMHWLMRETLTEPAALRSLREWPGSRQVYLDGAGEVPVIGAPVVQPALGRTLERLADAARSGSSREDGIRRARELFYRGELAEEMVRFAEREGGWLTAEDLAGFRVEIEDAPHVGYRGYDVYACGPWCQGPLVLETLNILEGYELASLRPGGAEAYHLILEALKAAFADRDRYVADPRVVPVPLDGLLSKEYAETWRRRIDTTRAAPEMPVPGDAWRHSERDEPSPSRWRPPAAGEGRLEPDTSYVCAVDAEGNAFSATPSDGAPGAPIVPELGIMLSSRGVQSWTDPDHPGCLAPGKRPRLTPNPGLILLGDELVMPYGTPGLDAQGQAMVQFVVNVVDFGMDVQAAIEAPRCLSYSFPSSSDPHAYFPGFAAIESRAGDEVIERLRALGHGIEAWPEWTGTTGSLAAIAARPAERILRGGADPRRVASALGR